MPLKSLSKSKEPSLNMMLFKLAAEGGPLGVFFLANLKFGFFTATGAFMAATVVSLAASLIVLRKLPVVPLITAVFVVLLGSLTLVMGDTAFMKIKPTVVNICFAALLLGGMAYGRLFLKTVFGDVFQIDDEGWRKLTVRWGSFFIFLAVLNELVRHLVTDDGWVNFKIFGIMPLTLAFSAMQLRLIQRHQLDETAEDSVIEEPSEPA
jgi:intracellular septation protein